MAGDWIKMRGNLWDDPRVGALVDATDSSEAAVIGGLYWLWAAADQHTEDGVMPGLSLRQIDRKTGIKGFAAALVGIGWLLEHDEGVVIVRFEEHNGTSAKRRGLDAKRKATVRNVSASKADNEPKECGGSAELEKEREKELVIHTELPTPPAADGGYEGSFEGHDDKPAPGPTPAGLCAVALNRAGFRVTSLNPSLVAYVAEGGTSEHLLQCAGLDEAKGKNAGYVLAIARRELTEPAPAPQQGGKGVAATPSRMPAASEVLAKSRPDPAKQTGEGRARAISELAESLRLGAPA